VLTLLPPDLAIDAVEITRIQCKGNASGLCATTLYAHFRENTYVRVYVKVNCSFDIERFCQRGCQHDGQPYIAGTALNSTITAKLSPQRSQYNDTSTSSSPLGFGLSGTLVVTVNPTTPSRKRIIPTTPKR